MPQIINLSPIGDVQPGDAIPVFDESNGDTRRMSVGQLSTYMEATLSLPDNAADIDYDPAGTGAVQRTVQGKLRDVVSVKDFGAVGNGVADDTAAIQAALNASAVVYLPKGIYIISSAINFPSQTRMYGDGIERTTIKAVSAGARIVNATNRHDAICLEDFTFDGNNIATTGISLGVSGTIGVLALSSADLLLRVKVAQCTLNGIVLNCIQYFNLRECIVASNTGGYATYINECSVFTIEDSLFTSNKTALWIGGDKFGSNPGGFSASQVAKINSCWFYGPYSGSAEGYVVLSNAYDINFSDCYFEHEISHSQPLIRIGRNGGPNVTGNIYFNECHWYGIAYNTDLIAITYGRRVYLKNCAAIPPNSGYYILNSIDNTAQIIIENCTANTAGYSSFDTVFWGDSASYVNAVSGTVKSIKFPDAYQTGTWTASITDGTNNATMSAFICNYVKIGRQVTVSGNVSTSSLGSVTGDISISGLPFPISGFASGAVGYAAGLAIAAGQSVTLLANNSGSSTELLLWDATTGTTRMQASEWSADGNISFTMTYTTTA